MNILKVFSLALDAILPRRDRSRRIEQRKITDIPVSPASHSLLNAEILTIINYKESAVADLMQSLKYDRSAYAARLCAEILEDYLREELSSLRTFSTQSIFLVPVPLHKNRERERGFNQIEKVLRHLSPEFQNGALSYMKAPLKRVRATKQQTHLSRKERLNNVAGAFALSDSFAIEKAHVILLDDIVTTGATLTEAARPFAQSGISVTLLALARA